ncbi:MAG: DUF1987 domain-containing protein [Bacteroidetes bacterium]|nr:MAG: DUF1987 domain-containing protein [Bacteroidota bacterium]
MENFYLDGTTKTPKLSLNPQTGKFMMSGRSIPENSIEFYKPLFEWLDEYVKNPSAQTSFDIQLEYFNTSSSKCLVEIFRRLEKIKDNDTVVNWFYEEDDEDMQESGEDFKEIIDLKIVMSMIES